MAEYLIQGETLIEIANSIREKTGKTFSMLPSEMASEILGIENSSSSISYIEAENDAGGITVTIGGE